MTAISPAVDGRPQNVQHGDEEQHRAGRQARHRPSAHEHNGVGASMAGVTTPRDGSIYSVPTIVAAMAASTAMASETRLPTSTRPQHVSAQRVGPKDDDDEDDGGGGEMMGE